MEHYFIDFIKVLLENNFNATLWTGRKWAEPTPGRGAQIYFTLNTEEVE
jgi:hypothetical protein